MKQGVLGRDISSSYSSTINKPYKRDEERSKVAARYHDNYSNEHLRKYCFQIQTLPVKFSLFQRAFQFTIYNGPTNALVRNKTLIQMSHIKTLKIIPTRSDQLMIETCWNDFVLMCDI
jgi:hypothetical protein